MTTLDARSREVEARLRETSWPLHDIDRIYDAADLIAEQREEIERLTAVMVLVPRMTLGPQS